MECLEIGSLVHYVIEGGPGKGEYRPAIIVSVPEDAPEPTADLTVLTQPDRDPSVILTVWRPGVRYSETREPATWHWPERKQGPEAEAFRMAISLLESHTQNLERVAERLEQLERRLQPGKA